MSAHEWRSTKRDEWTFCAICGVVRSADKETDCKGPTLHVDDYARGVADERARVVADLRTEARRLRAYTHDWLAHEALARKLDSRADRYERGEHEEKP